MQQKLIKQRGLLLWSVNERRNAFKLNAMLGAMEGTQENKIKLISMMCAVRALLN